VVVDYVMPVLNGIETIASFTSEMLQNTKVSHVYLVDIRFIPSAFRSAYSAEPHSKRMVKLSWRIWV